MALARGGQLGRLGYNEIMKIFRDYTLGWWQVALLKFALFFVGIAIGAYWAEVFNPFVLHLLIAGLAIGLYIKYVSFRQP